MAFADEIKTYKNTNNKEALAASVAEPAASPASAATAAPVTLPVGIPQHGEVYRDNEPAAVINADNVPLAAEIDDPTKGKEEIKVEAAVEVVTGDPTKVGDKIKIGTREFSNVEEAVAYAAELERGRAEDQAYIEGMKAAQEAAKKTEPEAPTETAYDKFSKKVFEDPKAAAVEFAEAIKQELRSEYQTTEQKKQIAQADHIVREQMWDNFFKENTDLSSPETQKYIRGYLLPTAINEKALSDKSSTADLAELARKNLKIQREAALPRTELQNKPTVTPTTTTVTTAAPAGSQKATPLDFIAELRTLRKKKAQ